MKINIQQLLEDAGILVENYIHINEIEQLATKYKIVPCGLQSDDYDGDVHWAALTDVPATVSDSEFNKLLQISGYPEEWTKEWDDDGLSIVSVIYAIRKDRRQQDKTLWVMQIPFQEWLELELSDIQDDFEE